VSRLNIFGTYLEHIAQEIQTQWKPKQDNSGCPTMLEITSKINQSKCKNKSNKKNLLKKLKVLMRSNEIR